MAQLPTSCGSAGGIELQGVTITSLADSFATDHIDLNATAEKSGSCYHVSASLHAALTFSLSGGILTPHLNVDPITVSGGVDAGCIVLLALVGGPIGVAITTAVDAFGPAIAEALADDAIAKALASGLPGVPTGNLGVAQLNSVSIATEGMTLQGTIPVIITAASASKILDLNGSVTTSDKELISDGVFHTQIWCMATPKDYPYAEYSQQQEGTFQLTGQFVQLPLSPVFTVNAPGTDDIVLTGPSGTVAIPNVDCHYPMPLMSSGVNFAQTVHIDYQIDGTGIRLRNRWQEGDYYIWLNATATGCDGQPLTDDNGQALSTYVVVQFEGDHVEIGGGYTADVQYCAELLAAWIRRINGEYKLWQKVPKWVEVNYPAPEELVAYVRDLLSLGLQETDDVLRTIKAAHGSSFIRAMLSPAATQRALAAAPMAVRGAES